MLFLLNYCMVIGKLRKTISENREPDKYTGDQTRQDKDISKPMAIKDEIRKENLKLKDVPFKKKVSLMNLGKGQLTYILKPLVSLPLQIAPL